MSDYDDTLGYSYWRGNVLGFDKFDEHHSAQSDKLIKNEEEEKKFEDTYGGHTYYFNKMSFNWDDSRDWVSFSKQTTMNNVNSAKLEEVGAHPDKLEEVGAHPKQGDVIVSKGGKEMGGGGKDSAKDVITPSRSFTKCTGAIPFIHKHACVTVGADDTHLHLTSATKEEINILYNGLDDIFNEFDDGYVDEDAEEAKRENADNAMEIVKFICFLFYIYISVFFYGEIYQKNILRMMSIMIMMMRYLMMECMVHEDY